MDILISHWHCIIPAIAILLAMFFLRGKDTGYGAAIKGSERNVERHDSCG